MRYSLLLPLVIVLFLQSCKETNFKSAFGQKASVGGQIIQMIPGAKLEFRGERSREISISKGGTFKLDTLLPNSGFYYLAYDQLQLPIYLENGKIVDVSFSPTKHKGEPKFKGDHTSENNFLQAFEEYKVKNQPADFEAFYTMEEPAFTDTLEKQFLLFNQFVQNYQQKNGTFSEGFATLIQKDLDFTSAGVKLIYPTYYAFFKKNKKLALSENYDSFLQNLKIDDEKNLQLPPYREFIKFFVEYQVGKDQDTSKTSLEKSFAQISSNFKDSKVKAYLSYQIMKEAIDNNVNDVTPLITEFATIQPDDRYLKEINKAYEAWLPLLAGRPAPDFEYEDARGKKIKLSALKGKVVYIDVWATWCGPCLAELPYLEDLQRTFTKNKDISFMSVSIDQDKTAWLTMLKKKSLKGLRLIADQNWQSKIVTDYQIQGIPRFIIIGKDGNIVDANAYRPSNEKLVQKLTKALR
jgi:thiol-disulfide isomerase/thioredoxin